MWTAHAGTRGGQRTPDPLDLKWCLWIGMWVRETDPGFSASTFYTWAISPAMERNYVSLYWEFLKQSLIHIFAYFLPNCITTSISRVIQIKNFANLRAQSLLEMVECVSAAFLLDSLVIFLSHTYKNERGGLLNWFDFFLLVVFLCILFYRDANNWELWRNHPDKCYNLLRE